MADYSMCDVRSFIAAAVKDEVLQRKNPGMILTVVVAFEAAECLEKLFENLCSAKPGMIFEDSPPEPSGKNLCEISESLIKDLKEAKMSRFTKDTGYGYSALPVKGVSSFKGEGLLGKSHRTTYSAETSVSIGLPYKSVLEVCRLFKAIGDHGNGGHSFSMMMGEGDGKSIGWWDGDGCHSLHKDDVTIFIPGEYSPIGPPWEEIDELIKGG